MRIVNLELSHTLPGSQAKVPEALQMQQLISVSIDEFEAILEPRYTQFLTVLMYLSLILIIGGIYVLWI